MADNLPLIPGKGSVCTDVRPIIRAVFCEWDYLPPLAIEKPTPGVRKPDGDGDHNQLTPGCWIEQYNSECKEIWTREGELKRKHAKRISHEPLPNIYKLYQPREAQPQARWKLERGLIDRRDLVPTIEQNAGRDESLWIKNILNCSSGDLSAVKQRSFLGSPVRLTKLDEDTIETLSIGAVVTHAPPPPTAPPLPLSQPDYILCVPPQLDFINFTIGQLHTQSLRLVNVSKFEVRLSVRPPKRPELDVELFGPRGLTVTSGAAAELRVHFKPSDVRAVTDTLLIRASMGRRDYDIPIACFMEPPILDILVPSVTSSVLSCTPDTPNASLPVCSSDVIELGARLLGDVHCARVLFHCEADHAAFFMLTEDAWLNLNLDCLTICGSVVAGPFVLWPAWWHGGGSVRGCAWCRADSAGLHAMPLRIVSSTAVVRHLHVLADTLLFRPDHLTIEAHEKDYDICGEGEPACEYYVHLGTAFPHRSLSASVQLINHSPVVYSYYWSVRPWGLCSCWEDEQRDEQRSHDSALGAEDDSERLCVGAKEAKKMSHEDPAAFKSRSNNARRVRVEPTRAQLMPRSSCAQHVQVPDVGSQLGVQRAVLMLILKDIPKESLPPDYEPMIISEEELDSSPVPGVKSMSRQVVQLVCAQMEVWWEVAPVRFMLDPPVLPLYHSRRIESIVVNISATQLYGAKGTRVAWRVPAQAPTPPPTRLAPCQSIRTPITVQLPCLPNEYPETDVFTLVAANEEWLSQCEITRQCATRHPSLRPGRAWLGVVAPGAHMLTQFQLHNDTHQHICWWAVPYRWWGENEPVPLCVGRPPCENCRELACSCGLLKPARGALQRKQIAEICYEVNAPEYDGCVATLVQVRRTGADVAQVHGAPATEARAALVFYRVLAPQLVLRLLPCYGDAKDCLSCKIDLGALKSKRGTAILRPLEALTVGRRTCYRLKITNITPLPTTVHFDRTADSMDILKAMFCPNDFSVRAYGEVEVRVVIDARKVCGRRLYVYRAQVDRAHRPLYLIIDTEISGLRIACDVPLGGDLKTDSFVIMRRTQREEYPWNEGKPVPSTAEEMFVDEDIKRQKLKAKKTCSCEFEMVYIPPPKILKPPASSCGEELTPIEIVTTPPELTRVCKCSAGTKPPMQELDDPICLQFVALPLNTVRERTLVLRNESVVTARWCARVRHWPRHHNRKLDSRDSWEGDVVAPGVALQVVPADGVLAAHAVTPLTVRVYADCWGLYHDQIIIQIDNVEPIVLDVWIEAVGPSLQLALQPSDKLLEHAVCMWMTPSDPERVLRAKNVSRSALTVHAYVMRCHEFTQDTLPFRLYLRYYDVPTRTCPCVTAFYYADSQTGEESDEISSITLEEEVDTGFELYFAPDYGVQDDNYYKVSPEVRKIEAGECVDWSVSMLPQNECAPDVNLVLRLMPDNFEGPGWYRVEPCAQVVRLRQSARAGLLSVSSKELRVQLCALDLPYGDELRVRKRFYLSNVGNGPLSLDAETMAPWSLVTWWEVPVEGAGGTSAKAPCGAGCACAEQVTARSTHLPLYLEPRSCIEVCVEVRVRTVDAWPTAAARAAHVCQSPDYPERIVSTTPLHLFDDHNVLQTVSLVLDLEYPILRVVPRAIDLGFIADSDTRKTFFSVSHTSRNVTLDVVIHWIGHEEFRIWPPFLRIPPGCSENVYIQYTAVWNGAPADGCAHVSVSCGAGGAGGAARERDVSEAWCRAAVPVRATPTRDHKYHRSPHDYTDDPHLLPPCVARAPPALQ